MNASSQEINSAAFTRVVTNHGSSITRCTQSVVSCDDIWEAAYERFETADEEVKKFVGRLRRLKIDQLPKSIDVVEIFCGRGNGIVALEHLGFTNIEGVDLSEPLLQKYGGTPRSLYVADCRQMPFENASKDLIIVQGGLHHLPQLPLDVTTTIDEVIRVLRPGGRFVIVEPYPTQALKWIHRISELAFVRMVSPRLDALAVMTQQERITYENWLRQGPMIRDAIMRRFRPLVDQISWTKWNFVGQV
jgi:SAM-dependent methyltransferase